MVKERYFFSGEIEEGKEILIEGSEAAHMVKVMRSRCKDVVEIINGKGVLALGEIVSIEKNGAGITILKKKCEEPAARKLILAQAMPKIHRLDLIVEKGTELGMTDLFLFDGDCSEKKGLSSAQEQRIEQQLIAAIKQCGRLFLPAVHYKPVLTEWSRPPEEIWVFGDLREGATPILTMKEDPAKKNIVAFVGPEAGFSKREVAWLDSQGAYGVKLHDNILRTETAALVMVAFLYSKFFLIRAV